MECICQWSNCNMVSKVMEFHIIAEVLQTSTKILCNKPDEHWDGWPSACRYTIYNPGTCNSHPRKLSLIINQLCNEYWWWSSCSLLSPRLCNQLRASFHQLRTNLSNSDSLNPLSGTSSIGSIDSPLSSSINPSLLHSRLKNFPFLHILPTVAFLFFFRTDSMDSPDCLPILLSISVFYFFPHFFLVFLFHAVN